MPFLQLVFPGFISINQPALIFIKRKSITQLFLRLTNKPAQKNN